MNEVGANGADRDETVTTAYRELAQETVPANIDSAVFRAASAPLQRGAGRFWSDAWFRPVTFAATLGLSMALLLQLSESGLLGPAGDDVGADRVPATVGEDALRDAAEATSRQIRRIEAENADTMQPDGTPAAAVPAASAPEQAGSRLPAEDSCSEDERADTGSWWRCIEDLERRGLSDAAETELRALLSKHPGFSVPR
jgi:hypothetical protein